MKYVGTTFEYETERNRDLMRAFRETLGDRDRPLRSIYELVVDKPSCRFWVSEERAAVVISGMHRGDSIECMRPLKREMYTEIYSRVTELLSRRPDLSLYEAVFEVVGSPAPKFYLSPGSAKVIICKIKRQWYTRRKRHRPQY